MKEVLSLLVFFMLVSCNNSSSSFDRPKSVEELKMELKAQEQIAPQEYLHADGKYNQNFFGTKFKVHCIVKNKATLVTFKDAVLKITYYSKTKTALGSKNITLYEIFPPNSFKEIDFKIENFNNVNSIGWEIVNATALE